MADKPRKRIPPKILEQLPDKVVTPEVLEQVGEIEGCISRKIRAAQRKPTAAELEAILRGTSRPAEPAPPTQPAKKRRVRQSRKQPHWPDRAKVHKTIAEFKRGDQHYIDICRELDRLRCSMPPRVSWDSKTWTEAFSKHRSPVNAWISRNVTG
jgi:hypothetical protein